MSMANFSYSPSKSIIVSLVQAWLDAAEYNIDKDDLSNAVVPNLNLMDPGEIKVINPILWKLAKKIELATQFKTLNAFSSTPFQVNF